MKANDNLTLTIFGASGDLAYRKLVPSVYDLYMQSLLPDCFAILGVGRTVYSDQDFRDKMIKGIKEFSLQPTDDEEKINSFINLLYYVPVDSKKTEDFAKLKDRLQEISDKCHTEGNVIFYLSTPPSLYEIIPANLSAHGLNKEDQGWRRLIVEKPFGYDYETAQALNSGLLKYFEEKQIYRIDHYLGKETVQNMLVFRFSNGIFEPLWNRNYIHHIEITASESIGVGERGGYYEGSGALRDMLQNHLMQLVGLAAMEPPTKIEADSIRNETLKVFEALRPIGRDDVSKYAIRGQYGAATVKGESMKAYREETGVDPDSRTETFAAIKLFIDNWRWSGVPFYIRSGKRLPTRVAEVVVYFKKTPLSLFGDESEMTHEYNQLVLRIQPDEGVLLKFGLKVPGAGFKAETVNMDFHYSGLSDAYLPSAYERLLLDSMRGDATLFTRGDAVLAAWKFVDPILKAWKKDPNVPLYQYPSGTWGPEVADKMIDGEDVTWRYPCRNLADDGIFCEL
ncbi:MAG: glucose-6-phosphate dehydrogenase [Bacteroidia bacterium]|nr:glucose-6-phosphate dehydrogenase [Bacteroidia bacterium]